MIIYLLSSVVVLFCAMYLCFNPSKTTVEHITNSTSRRKALFVHILELCCSFLMYGVLIYFTTIALMLCSTLFLKAYYIFLELNLANYDYDGFIVISEQIALVITLIVLIFKIRTIESLANIMAKKREKSLSLFALCKKNG
ncbi:hypothetical protein [Cysteiniphilum marinum]|uniref:hypothetical protein n=3 Tax=Cysteiniphilum TaxID=2056696 RepID=UPI001782ECE3|nr:hypothetical protein [Cysteiniphilum marinum]